jgi:hypothetical protein
LRAIGQIKPLPNIGIRFVASKLRERVQAMPNAMKLSLVGLAAILGIFAAIGSAMAELRVISSTAPGVKADAAFPDSAVFDVPAGAKIKFLKTPANSTHEIAGPYKGTLEAYKPASCGWVDWASGKCNGGSSDQPGATRAAPVAGGTRSLSRPTPAQPGN